MYLNELSNLRTTLHSSLGMLFQCILLQANEAIFGIQWVQNRERTLAATLSSFETPALGLKSPALRFLTESPCSRSPSRPGL